MRREFFGVVGHVFFSVVVVNFIFPLQTIEWAYLNTYAARHAARKIDAEIVQHIY